MEYYNFIRENIDVPIDDKVEGENELQRYERIVKGIESKKDKEVYELDDLLKGN